MILPEALRKQMQDATQMLVSGGVDAATAAIQKSIREMSGSLNTGHGNTMPDFARDLLSQLGVTAREQEVEIDQIPVGSGAAAPASAQNPGQFLTRSYTNAAGTRAYKLYIPGSYHGQPVPLVVMLHGCTQNPDDFANGTRMNTLAEEKQCIVVYPAQALSANSSGCWNWFKAIDQQREQGEPSIIAGITREVAAKYQIEPGKVFVAGLSAGGAMAVIMATAYPELYAAVGVHSGLPFAAAHDLPSALSAMRGKTKQGRHAAASRSSSIPMIVFHGDSDNTVNSRNGEQLMQQNEHAQPDVIIQQGQVPNGHRYTCTSHHGDAGQLLAEHWVIHGAGHAWAGGSSSGSYTDPRGPDASREMLRFFYAQASDAKHVQAAFP